jgi:hypothetical protein
MVMVSLLGQNDEMVRFQSLGKKAESAFPNTDSSAGHDPPHECTGRRQYRYHGKRDMISVLR